MKPATATAIRALHPNQTDPPQDLALVVISALDQIRAELAKIQSQPPSRILNIKEAVQYMRLPLGTVRELVQKGKITYIKPGKLILFRRQDLDQYLEEHTVYPRPLPSRRLIRD